MTLWLALSTLQLLLMVPLSITFTVGFPNCINFTFPSSKQFKRNSLPAPSVGSSFHHPRLHKGNGIHRNTKGAEWNALKVRYSRDGDGYFDLPWSVEEATTHDRWQKIDHESSLNVEVYSQPQDPRLLLLFDKKGTIAGLRLSFLKQDVSRRAEEGGYSFDFDYDNNPLYEKGRYFGKDLWHTTILLTSPSELANGGRNLLDKDRDEVATDVYFRHNGEWTKMSRDECKTNQEFVEGRCVAGMGKHYFYKLNMTDCSHQQPLWSLYDNGRLMGLGLAGYGSFTKSGRTRNYYEHGVIPNTLDYLPLCFSDYTIFSIFSLDAIKRIMRIVPPCIEEYTEKFGLTMMHVFLKKEARTVTCPAKEWRFAHCR